MSEREPIGSVVRYTNLLGVRMDAEIGRRAVNPSAEGAEFIAEVIGPAPPEEQTEPNFGYLARSMAGEDVSSEDSVVELPDPASADSVDIIQPGEVWDDGRFVRLWEQ